MFNLNFNLAAWDRALRTVVGLLMLVLGASGAVHGIWRPALLIFSTVPLLTALLGWCPFYAIMGLSTHSRPSPELPADEDTPSFL